MIQRKMIQRAPTYWRVMDRDTGRVIVTYKDAAMAMRLARRLNIAAGRMRVYVQRRAPKK